MEIFLQIMNSFFGAIVLLLSLIFIPEIRNSTKYKVIAILSIILMFGIGTYIIFIDRTKQTQQNIKDEKSDSTINALTKMITDLKNDNINEKASRSKFENFLKDTFNIIRDSNNKPILNRNTYNTRIDRAGSVKIGGN